MNEDLLKLKQIMHPLQTRLQSLEGTQEGADLSKIYEKIETDLNFALAPFNEKWQEDFSQDLQEFRTSSTYSSQTKNLVLDFYHYDFENFWISKVTSLIKKTLLIEEKFLEVYRRKIKEFIQKINFFEIKPIPKFFLIQKIKIYYFAKKFEASEKAFLIKEKIQQNLLRSCERQKKELESYFGKKILEKELFFSPPKELLNYTGLNLSLFNSFALWKQIQKLIQSQMILSKKAVKGHEENIQPLLKKIKETKEELNRRLELINEKSVKRRTEGIKDFLNQAFRKLFLSIKGEQQHWETARRRNEFFFKSLLQKEEELKIIRQRCEKILRK